MQQLRLFWAINLPPPVKARLAAIMEEFKPVHADVKWVEEQNLHITVQFLGEVGVSRIPEIITAVEKTLHKTTPFTLHLGGLGFFPDNHRPRVLWVGIKGDVEHIKHTAELVQNALAPLGFPVEKRPFVPHLTLGRLRSNRGVKELIAKVSSSTAATAELGNIRVESIDLMQSKLSRQGPTYTLLTSIRLV